LVEEGKTGYLFPRNDHDALVTQAVRHLQRPPHERRQMRHACIVAARTRWTLDQHLDQLEGLYAQVHEEIGWRGASPRISSLVEAVP
jgi:glycosyltransferase involved in cell wall biosynthesis